MLFCLKCGAQLPDGAKFCVECGAPTGARNYATQEGDPECFCSRKYGSMAYISGRGLYIREGNGTILFLSEGRLGCVRVIAHKRQMGHWRGDISWIGSWKGLLYYIYLDEKEISLIRYDPESGEGTVVLSGPVEGKTPSPLTMEYVNLLNGYCYGISRDKKNLIRVDLESGKAEQAPLPVEAGGSGWFGLTLSGRYGYTSLFGWSGKTIRFDLKNPAIYTWLPNYKEAFCANPREGLFDVYEGTLLGVGAWALAVLPTQGQQMGPLMVNERKRSECRNWWRCGPLYMVPRNQSSTELLNMDGDTPESCGVPLPAAVDFLSLGDGSAYVLTTEDLLYFFPVGFYDQLREHRDLGRYLAVDMKKIREGLEQSRPDHCPFCGTPVPTVARICHVCDNSLWGDRPEDPSSICSEKTGRMAYIQGRGLYLSSGTGVISLLPDGRFHVGKVVDHTRPGLETHRGTIPWMGSWNGKLYYFFEELGDRFHLASFDPETGEETILRTGTDMRTDRLSGFTLRDGVCYGLSVDGRYLVRVELENGQVERRRLPVLHWDDLDSDWRRAFQLRRDHQPEGERDTRVQWEEWRGLRVFGNYGYTGIWGVADTVIQFSLQEPEKFVLMPDPGLNNVVDATDMGFDSALDVYDGHLVGLGNCISSMIYLTGKGLGQEFSKDRTVRHTGHDNDGRAWWRCGQMYMFPGSRKTDAYDANKRKWTTLLRLPMADDFLTLEDGSVYVLARRIRREFVDEMRDMGEYIQGTWSVFHFPAGFERRAEDTEDLRKYMVTQLDWGHDEGD